MVNRCRCRTYTTHSVNGPEVLVSWIQRKCQRCCRFLSKHQQKYCSRCKPLMDKKVKRKDSKTRYYNKLEEYTLRAKVRYNPDRFNVGDLV